MNQAKYGKHSFIFLFTSYEVFELPTHNELNHVSLKSIILGEQTLWCAGEILSYGDNNSTDTSLKLIGSDWEQGNLRFEKLNGRFLLVIGDNKTHELTMVTDPLGSFHAYVVWHNGRAKVIGTDLATLAKTASSRKLDWEAITTFFAFGFFLDDRTYYQDIRILLPGSLYRFSGEGELLEHRKYLNWNHQVNYSRSYSETIDEYHTLLQQAVRRCSADVNVLLPISGGLDSRSIAAVMPSGGEVSSYSYGYTSDSIETHIASQIAKARDFTFTSHVISPYLFERLAEIIEVLHGSQDVTQARQASISDWLKSHGDAVLTGLWGDVWCDQMGLADGLPAGETLVSFAIKKLEKRGNRWLIEKISSNQLGEHSTEALLKDLVGLELDKLGFIDDLDFRLKIYKTTHWAFRWSNASLRAFEMGATPRIPYYDVDLVNFFCTVPTAFVRERRLQIDHLKRYAPDLARIRWQQTDTNLYRISYSKWANLPRRAYNKIRRTLTNERPIQRNWEVQFLSAEGRRNLERWLLKPNLRIHEFVSPSEISTLLTEFYNAPQAANGYTVSMLLTFAAWIEENT